MYVCLYCASMGIFMSASMTEEGEVTITVPFPCKKNAIVVVQYSYCEFGQ